MTNTEERDGCLAYTGRREEDSGGGRYCRWPKRMVLSVQFRIKRMDEMKMPQVLYEYYLCVAREEGSFCKNWLVFPRVLLRQMEVTCSEF